MSQGTPRGWSWQQRTPACELMGFVQPRALPCGLARRQSARHSADAHRLNLSYERRGRDEPLHGFDAPFFFGCDDVKDRRRDTEGDRLDALAPQLGFGAEVLLYRVDYLLDVHAGV